MRDIEGLRWKMFVNVYNSYFADPGTSRNDYDWHVPFIVIYDAYLPYDAYVTFQEIAI